MPPNSPASSPLLKPLVALAVPGMYLYYKYNEYKRQQHEHQRRKVTERELEHLNSKIDKLLTKIDDRDVDVPIEEEEECAVCLGAKATMQTFPCGHKVLCRKCFIQTIQFAVSQRCLPLRCVICRARILKLRQGGKTGSKRSPSDQKLGPKSTSANKKPMVKSASADKYLTSLSRGGKKLAAAKQAPRSKSLFFEPK